MALTATVAVWVNFALAAATTTFAVIDAKKRQRKQAREAAQREIDARPSGSGEDAGVFYGRCARELPVVHAAIAPHIPASGTAYVGAVGRIRNTRNDAGLGRLDGTDAYAGAGRFVGVRGDARDAQMLQVHVAGAGENDALLDVWINDLSVRDTIRLGRVSLFKLGAPGAPLEMETLFAPTDAEDGRRLTATDKFTGKSHVAGVTWQNADDPMFGAEVPPVTAFMRGAKVRRIVRSGSGTEADPYVHALSARAWSPNAVLARLDYLLSPDYGPEGLTWANDFDHRSWFAAQETADEVVQGANATNALEKVPDPRVASGEMEYGAGETYRRWGADNGSTGWRADSPTGGMPDGSVFKRHDPDIETVRRYEFHGWVPTALDYLEVRERMLEVMPGAIEWVDNEGRLRLSLPDSKTPAADQRSATIDESKRVAGTLAVAWPDNGSRANRITVSFADVALDFARSDAQWPAPGSALAAALLALDGGVELRATLELEGVCDERHAFSIAANYCAMSRRETYRWESPYSEFDLAPGDVVRLKDSKFKLDVDVRIVDKRPLDDRIRFEAMRFVPQDYAWFPEPDQAAIPAPPPNLDLPAPTAVAAVHDPATNATTITWAFARTINAAGFEVQHRLDAGDWTPVARTGPDARRAAHVTELGDHHHQYRVRAEGVGGGWSDWAESAAVEVDVPAVVPGPLYGAVPEGGCPPAAQATGSGRLWIAPDGRVWRDGPDPWTETIPANVGADGADFGLLARFEGVGTPGHATAATTFVPSGNGNAWDLLTALAPFRRLPASLNSFYVAGLRYRRDAKRWKLDLSATVPATAEATGADLPEAVAKDLVIGLRKPDGATVWTRLGDDRDDPSFWTDDAGDGFFTGVSNIGPCAVLFARASKRCASDPLSQWLPLPGFDGGEDGLTTEQAFAATATSDPPAALAAGLDYRASPAAADPPVAGTAYRTRPNLSAALPFGWVNERAVSGSPAQGADVGDVAWRGWALAEHYGDGGEDGEGIEWIHCLNDDTSIPSSEQPPDSMVYDAARNSSGRDVGVRIVNGRVSTAARGGRVWFDEQPEEGSAAQPWLASMFRRVPGIPDRATVPSGDGWGAWRGPVFERVFASDGTDAVQLSHPIVDGVLAWDDGWKAGTTRLAANRGATLSNVLVEWSRGGTRIEAIRVQIDARLDAAGTPQCRMRLSGIGSSPEVRVDGTVRTGTYATPYTGNFPCRHTIEVAGVVCQVVVRKDAAPSQLVTVDPESVVLLVPQTGVTYSGTATWTKAGASGAAASREVRFSVRTTSFASAPNVAATTVSGSLGDAPSKGTRQGSTSQHAWMVPFAVEGVTVRVHVVYVDTTN